MLLIQKMCTGIRSLLVIVCFNGLGHEIASVACEKGICLGPGSYYYIYSPGGATKPYLIRIHREEYYLIMSGEETQLKSLKRRGMTIKLESESSRHFKPPITGLPSSLYLTQMQLKVKVADQNEVLLLSKKSVDSFLGEMNVKLTLEFQERKNDSSLVAQLVNPVLFPKIVSFIILCFTYFRIEDHFAESISLYI